MAPHNPDPAWSPSRASVRQCAPRGRPGLPPKESLRKSHQSNGGVSVKLPLNLQQYSLWPCDGACVRRPIHAGSLPASVKGLVFARDEQLAGNLPGAYWEL